MVVVGVEGPNDYRTLILLDSGLASSEIEVLSEMAGN